MINSMKQTSLNYTNIAILVIAGFVAGVIVGFALFSPGIVFGVDATVKDYQAIKMSALNGPYVEVMAATINATNQTEGFMIDSYVDNIMNQTSNFTGLGEPNQTQQK